MGISSLLCAVAIVLLFFICGIFLHINVFWIDQLIELTDMALSLFRLTTRVPKSYTFNADSMAVSYRTRDNDVRMTSAETTNGGIRSNGSGRDYGRVSRSLLSYYSLIRYSSVAGFWGSLVHSFVGGLPIQVKNQKSSKTQRDRVPGVICQIGGDLKG